MKIWELIDSKTNGEDSEAESEENRRPSDIEVETNIKGGTFHFKGERKRRKNGGGEEERKKEKDRFSISGFEWSLSFEGEFVKF